MGTKIERIQLLLQQRVARKRGPLSSDQYNDTVDELANDSAELNTQWNNRLVPLTTTLPDGSDDTSVDAFKNGLDGTSMYIDADVTTGDYYNSTSNRPNTIKEQLVDVYQTITDLDTELTNEISNSSVTASQIAVADTPSLYDGEDVEACLTEVMQDVNALALTNYNIEDLMNVDTAGVTPKSYLKYDGSNWVHTTASGLVENQGGAIADRLAIWADTDGIKGTQYWSIDGSGNLESDTTASIYLTAGTAAAPSLAFKDATDLGFYLYGAGSIGITTGGTLQWYIASTGNIIAVEDNVLHVGDGVVGNCSLGFKDDNNVGFIRPANDTIGVVNAGAESWRFTSSKHLVAQGDYYIQVGDGVVGSPSVSFKGDPDTGIYSAGANQIGFAVGGAVAVTLDQYSLAGQNTVKLRATDGTTAFPGFGFTDDSNTGLYRPGSDQIGVVCGGTEIATCGNASILFNAHISQSIATILTPTGITQTVDWDNGNLQVIDLEDATGDVTLTLSNPDTGAFYLIKIIQDSGGAGRDIVWPATVLWDDGIAPVISVGNTAIDIVTMFYDGANYHANISQNKS